MVFDIRWHCRQGNRTADNRDHIGIGVRGDAVMIIVLDGSTAGLSSGYFARAVARHMVDWFVSAAQNVNADRLEAQLRATHDTLAGDFRKDSASYALLYVEAAKPAVVLHAGDCLVGRRGVDGRATWLMQPHTLANALRAVPIEILANEPARHRVTRSFRSRQFMAPDRNSFALDDQTLLVATDGFWAELDSARQNAFVEGRLSASSGDRDDCGVLLISRTGHELTTKVAGVHSAGSIYLRGV
ncbi:hypothetical protein ACTG4Q_11945 [Bradyrhizobium denitrificans]